MSRAEQAPGARSKVARVRVDTTVGRRAALAGPSRLLKDTVILQSSGPAVCDRTGLRVWLHALRQHCDMQTREIPWSGSREWSFRDGALVHREGGFFSIVGATLEHAGIRHRDQPLIDQPEIGILGFLARKGRHGPEILVQGKPEPGNVGVVQIAPTVQATESNYTCRHGGRPTPFIERFLSPEAAAVRSDSLQSEQGTRFLGKYNRNMVVDAGATDDRTPTAAHRWSAAAELLPLLSEDFLVNTDARSVLVSTPWHVFSRDGTPFGRWRARGGLGEALLQSYTAEDDEAAAAPLLAQLRLVRDRAASTRTAVVPLDRLNAWTIDGRSISAAQAGPFEVRQYAVTTSVRETTRWDQPLLASRGIGSVVLLAKRREGVLRFLFRARAEIGFRERVQYGPTCLDEDGLGGPSFTAQDAECRAHARGSTPLLSTLQSDEGGRFFQCVSRYSVRLLPAGATMAPDDSMAWMTLGQIATLLRVPGAFTNEARSALSMLLAFL